MGMLLLYLVLGTVMDSLAMIFLAVPIFVPIITQLKFGILVLMSAEIGLIAPPVGLNLFVINTMAKKVGIGETYKRALPIVLSDIIRIIVLVTCPTLTLGLVRWLNEFVLPRWVCALARHSDACSGHAIGQGRFRIRLG